MCSPGEDIVVGAEGERRLAAAEETVLGLGREAVLAAGGQTVLAADSVTVVTNIPFCDGTGTYPCICGIGVEYDASGRILRVDILIYLNPDCIIAICFRPCELKIFIKKLGESWGFMFVDRDSTFSMRPATSVLRSWPQAVPLNGQTSSTSSITITISFVATLRTVDCRRLHRGPMFLCCRWILMGIYAYFFTVRLLEVGTTAQNVFHSFMCTYSCYSNLVKSSYRCNSEVAVAGVNVIGVVVCRACNVDLGPSPCLYIACNCSPRSSLNMWYAPTDTSPII